MAITQDSAPVIKQFEDQVDLYSKHDEEVSSPVLPFFEKNLKKIGNGPIHICEFGGGGGDLLRAIRKLTKKKLILTNAELVTAFKKNQALKEIRFFTRSLLDSKFADDSFDIVIVRNVIHHLIGSSLAQTRINQQHALEELVRVTKPGGYILIDEQVNNSQVACTLYYVFSRLATRLGLSVERYQITPNTIVGYLTRKELQQLALKALPLKYRVADSYKRWIPEWHWKLTGLMNDTGTAFIAMKKPLHG